VEYIVTLRTEVERPGYAAASEHATVCGTTCNRRHHCRLDSVWQQHDNCTHWSREYPPCGSHRFGWGCCRTSRCSGNITFTIQFAPGTLNPQSTRVSVELDTDQSASTGNGVAGPLGVDYALDLYASSQTTISRATPSTCSTGGPCYTTVGTASLTLGMDTMTATVPLATLGNASGRINFRVGTYVFPSPVTPTPSADWMPDITLPPAHVP
jgi:hypothetical protein